MVRTEVPTRETTGMARLTSWVLAHRGLVALAWIAIALAGGLNATRTVDRLSTEFNLPGQPAYETNQAIHDRFGGGGSADPLLLVARGDNAQTRVGDTAGRVQRAVAGTRVVTAVDPGGEALTSDRGLLSVAVLYPPATQVRTRTPPRSRRLTRWLPMHELPRPTGSTSS